MMACKKVLTLKIKVSGNKYNKNRKQRQTRINKFNKITHLLVKLMNKLQKQDS